MERTTYDWEQEAALWRGPIVYYGKVVDERGNPIQGAQASYTANSLDNTLQEIEHKGTAISDERGVVKVEGAGRHLQLADVVVGILGVSAERISKSQALTREAVAIGRRVQHGVSAVLEERLGRMLAQVGIRSKPAPHLSQSIQRQEFRPKNSSG
jgi:hypothetical protein